LSRANGIGRALLGLVSQGIQCLALNALQAGDSVGADTLMRLWVHLAQQQVAVVHEGVRGGAVLTIRGHHLCATADHQILGAGHDVHGRQIYRGDARAAKAVQGHTTGANIVARFQCGHTRQVAALASALGAGAEDNVSHFRRVQVIALGEGLEH
jgi:hypothetical protein